MDFRVLEYFLMVAREGNITKAAQILHVSQPTISRQMMQLEADLNVKLFQRSNHNIYLTKEGILFRRRAQELLDLYQKTRNEMKETIEELNGEINIGCGELKSFQELSQIMAGFYRLHPNVHFTIHSGNNEDILELLKQGNLDMGLFLEPMDLVQYDLLRLKTKEEWGILVAQDSPLAQKKYIVPGELVGTKVITIRDRLVQFELAKWSDKYAKEMANLATYNLVNNASMMVREGMGPAICLRLEAEYEGLKFIPFEPKIEMSSVLAWKGKSVMSNTVRAFVDYCGEQVRESKKNRNS